MHLSVYSEVEHNNISDMILLIYQKPLETTMGQCKQLMAKESID